MCFGMGDWMLRCFRRVEVWEEVLVLLLVWYDCFLLGVDVGVVCFGVGLVGVEFLVRLNVIVFFFFEIGMVVVIGFDLGFWYCFLGVGLILFWIFFFFVVRIILMLEVWLKMVLVVVFFLEVMFFLRVESLEIFVKLVIFDVVGGILVFLMVDCVLWGVIKLGMVIWFFFFCNVLLEELMGSYSWVFFG